MRRRDFITLCVTNLQETTPTIKEEKLYVRNKYAYWIQRPYDRSR
jgi:hypothetical protein